MNQDDDPDALAALLPFYASGRLDAARRARIDAALATQPALRAELAEVRALQAQIRRAGERLQEDPSASASSAARLDGLLSRIAASSTAASPSAATPVAAASEPAPPAIDLDAERSRRAPPASSARPRLAIAIAAGLAIVCIAQGVMLHRRSADRGPREGEYASLSGPSDDAAATGVRFTVRFGAQASWSEVQGLCARLRLRIVGGPEEGRVDVAPIDRLTPAQGDALEAELKRSPAVVFVGRQG